MVARTDAENDPVFETLHKHGEKIAKLEANQMHLATKADIEKLRADLTWRIVIAMSVLTGIFVLVIQLQLGNT